MNHEYIIQKDGYKAKICVDINTYKYSALTYRISHIDILPKGKRKWMDIGELFKDSFSYRKLDFDGRNEYAKREYLRYVTFEDICAAVENAYSNIKPNYNEIEFRAV